MNYLVCRKLKGNLNVQIHKMNTFVLFCIITCLISSCSQMNTLQQGVTSIHETLKDKAASLETKKQQENKSENQNNNDQKNNDQKNDQADTQASNEGQSTVQMKAGGKKSSVIRSLGGISMLTRDSEPEIEMETGKSFEVPMKTIVKYAEFAEIVGKPDDQINTYFEQFAYKEFQIKELSDYALKYLMFENDTCRFIVIRGTKNISNAVTDILAIPWYDTGLKIWMHSGFRNASSALFKQLETDGIDKNKKYIIIGHSLGGAIASILGIHFYRNDYKLDKIVTFGQPKFTDEKGAHKYRMLPVIRVVGSQDIITILPPTTDVVIFSHLGLKIHLDKSNLQYEKVGSASNYKDDVVLPRNPDFMLLFQAYTHRMEAYLEKLNAHNEKTIKIDFENKHNWLSKKPDPET